MPDQVQSAIRLIVFKADGSKKTLGLKVGRYVVGRHHNASLRIPLPSVSRQHCELICEQSTLRVKDLGSANGTYRNSQRIEDEAELQAGDTLAVGPVQIVVQINGEPAQVDAPAGGGGDVDMEATPPAGSPTVADSSDDDSGASHADTDLDETIARETGMGSLLKGNAEDSSVFDFDFDFEDDENPKL